jgi:hypothetical protein
MSDDVITAQGAPPARKPLVGPVYREFIAALLAKKMARNYLEVGVREGGTLVRADCPSIGVDPLFTFNQNPVGKKRVLHLYQMTSDEYFRDHDPRAVFGGPVDVAFLDGLHQFEYLLRDFINTERVCSRDSVILLDDAMPINIEMTERQRRPDLRQDKPIAGWWTGDVWKVVPILQELRPDLRITPVDVRPTGSVMITNLDPGSNVLYERYFDIVEKYIAVDFTPETFDAYWEANKPIEAARLISNFDLSLYIRP